MATTQRINDTALNLIHGIKVTAEFVPWSKSRNFKKEPKATDLNLNWKVTVWHGAAAILLDIDYMAGQAHCPSYKQASRWTLEYAAQIDFECEYGKEAGRFNYGFGIVRKLNDKPIMPDACDVVYCLLSDAGVLDYGSFEDWADNMGYDQDSREAEQFYRACLATSLKLRSALGEDRLKRLREDFQDF